ncbi:hypothetical protein POVCU2_0082180, partial [Plasmodium ovale curtisi]
FELFIVSFTAYSDSAFHHPEKARNLLVLRLCERSPNESICTLNGNRALPHAAKFYTRDEESTLAVRFNIVHCTLYHCANVKEGKDLYKTFSLAVPIFVRSEPNEGINLKHKKCRFNHKGYTFSRRKGNKKYGMEDKNTSTVRMGKVGEKLAHRTRTDMIHTLHIVCYERSVLQTTLQG